MSADGQFGADDEASQRQGLLYALVAYGIWGVAPIYFVWVGFAGPLEILMHRALWSVPLLILLISVTGQWAVARSLSRRELLFLLATALCLSINWLTFIWAIQAQRIADASLGYFANPGVDLVAIVFMFIAGINFALHFAAWQRKSIRHYLTDPEFLFYAFILLLVSLITISVLYFSNVYSGIFESFIKGLFH